MKIWRYYRFTPAVWADLLLPPRVMALSAMKPQLEMLLIPNTLCWSSRKCNCACAIPAEVQLRLRVTRRSWQKLFAGKNFVKILVTAQTQLRLYSELQRAFGNSNICNCGYSGPCWQAQMVRWTCRKKKWGWYLFKINCPQIKDL